MKLWLPATVVFLSLAAGACAATQIPVSQSGARPAREELVMDGKAIGERVPARPGELCVICNKPVTGEDIVYLVGGQRVPIHHHPCIAAWSRSAGSPDRFLANLRPRGAFLGAGAEGQQVSSAWFLFGLYVLAGLVFAALCAHRALHAGRSAPAWFGAGLALNAFGYLLLLTRPKLPIFAPAGVPAGLRKVATTYEPVPCPGCGEHNHPSATECPGCGGRLLPAIPSEVEKAGLRPK